MANQNISRKQSFHEWLKENKKLKLKHSATAIIAAFEVASGYGMTHHIFSKAFWDMDSPAEFAQACRKLLGYKVFVALQKYSAELLNRYDSLYYDFLKSLMESNDIQKSIGAQKKEENTKAEDSVRFDNIRDLSHTKPVRAVYFEEEISCSSSWKALYVDVLRALSIDYPHVFNKNLSFGHRKGPEFGDKNAAEQMIAPAEVNNSLYAETNYSSTDIVKRIRQLLDLCNVDYENLIIFYNQDLSLTTQTESQSEEVHNVTEWIIEAIKPRKIQYCDNRNVGGCLWIVGGHELDTFISECTEKGYAFHYKSDGCKVFPLKKVWWTKSSIEFLEHDNKKDSNIISSQLAPLCDTDFDTELMSAAEIIIPKEFPNGLRKSSQIARKRFNTVFRERSGFDLPEVINLDDLALSVGIEYENKIYVPSKEIKQLIQNAMLNAKNNGYGVIFYEEFYNAFATQLSSDCVFSADLLKKVLKHIMPDMVFCKTYACFSKNDSLIKDIIYAYGNETFLSYNEIKRRLPYADLYQIRLACSRDAKFVSMGDEVYALADRINIATNDIHTAKRSIEKDIERHGFSVINSINVDESESLNPEISPSALRTLLFDKYLSSQYSRKRSIITRSGVIIRMNDVMKDYCLEHEEITIEQIEAYEREVSGKFACGLSAAFDSMVRIDKDTFVHRDLISFDINAIDRAIALYVKNNIYPIADIQSFISFPYIEGYSWNVFLLDSFCSHYSKSYRSMGGPAQSDIIGAIYPVSMSIDNYSDLLAQVAADSGLELTDDIISDYFSKHKFLLRKSNINEVLAKAQKIRLKEE